MSTVATTIPEIVDSNCTTLLDAMQAGHKRYESNLGISIALYYPDDSSVPGFFGYGAAGPHSEVTDQTVYSIGSVTKVFTATLASYLSVQGTIGELGKTPVKPYLSNPSCTPPGVSGPYWDGVTFLKFATHTSGMPDQAPGQYSEPLFGAAPPDCSFVSWWNQNAAAFENEEGDWIYSSAGFVTLGFAVAGAALNSGLSGGYPQLLNEVITSQLGMPYTFAADNVPPGAALARGYNKKGRVSITGAADLKSTAKDMLVWLTAVDQAMQLMAVGGSMSPLQQAIANTTEIHIKHPKKPDKTPTGFAMGLGWQIPTLGSATILTKNGGTSRGGCSCWVGLTRREPGSTPVGIALMTNQFGVSPDGTARAILSQILEMS